LSSREGARERLFLACPEGQRSCPKKVSDVSDPGCMSKLTVGHGKTSAPIKNPFPWEGRGFRKARHHRGELEGSASFQFRSHI